MTTNGRKISTRGTQSYVYIIQYTYNTTEQIPSSA